MKKLITILAVSTVLSCQQGKNKTSGEEYDGNDRSQPESLDSIRGDESEEKDEKDEKNVDENEETKDLPKEPAFTLPLRPTTDRIDDDFIPFFDESELALGESIFMNKCTPCHGNFGEGNSIGPNLTDDYWLHGGGIKNVFTTIKYGVPERLL